MSDNSFTRYDFGKNCVCIGRVSTSEQSKTAQIRDLEAFAHNLGYEKVQVFFSTESGFIDYDSKQGWNQVVEFFENNPDFKVLIAPEVSRLSRKESILYQIKDFLIENKIQLLIKDIKFTLFDEWGNIPQGNDVVFALYASMASAEMRQKKERFKRSLKDYRIQGYSIGGRELFGYTRYYELFNGKHRSKYKINEKEAEEIIQVYQWYAYGIDGDLTNTSILAITQECIARNFSPYLHSKRNVNKCLKNEAYCGRQETRNRIPNPDYYIYNKQDVPQYIPAESYICTYPPIFSGDLLGLFYRVKERLVENNTRYSDNVPVDKSRLHTTILSRLIPCPCCGRYLIGEYRLRKDTTPSFSYRCNQSRGVLNKCEHTCLISMRMLDSVVWGYCEKEVIRTILDETDGELKNRISGIESKIENLRRLIDNFDYLGRVKHAKRVLDKQVEYLNSDFIDTAYEDYAKTLSGINEEYNNYQKQINELTSQKEGLKEIYSLSDAMQKHKSISSNKKMLYTYIHKLVEQIEIVYSHRFFTIIRIHLRGRKVSEYIYIYKKSTLNIRAYKVSAYNTKLLNLYRKEFAFIDTPAQRRYLANYLPDKPEIRWDKENLSFQIGETSVSASDMLVKYRINDIQGTIPDEQSNIISCDLDRNRLWKLMNDAQLREELFVKSSDIDTDVPAILIDEIPFEMLNFYHEDINRFSLK